MRAELRCRQQTASNPFKDSRRGDFQSCGRVIDGQFQAAAPLTEDVHADRVPASKRANTARSPAFSMGCAISVAVQNRGDHSIGLQPREPADKFNRIPLGDETMLSGKDSIEVNLRVIATLPMQKHLHCGFRSGHDYFRENGAQNALFVFRRTLWMRPQPSEIAAKREE
jgi:hypothetical protein